MLQQHTAADTFQDQAVHFHIVVLQKQIFAWIGTTPPRLSNLCLATPTRLVKPLPPPAAAAAAAPRLHLESRATFAAMGLLVCCLNHVPLDTAAGPCALCHLAAAWPRRRRLHQHVAAPR